MHPFMLMYASVLRHVFVYKGRDQHVMNVSHVQIPGHMNMYLATYMHTCMYVSVYMCIYA
jgi:hypothetical protein